MAHSPPGAHGDRPGVEQYFMDMTHLVKVRGTCPRRRVGAVIVKGKRVLTTGYNGAPRNFPHPIDVGCLRDELQIPHGMLADICPCLHAEQNAIIQAATTGVSIDGADLYCTTQPCTQCSRMVANCGIKRVVFEEEYPDPLATGILTTSGVELWKWDATKKKATRLANPNTFEQAQAALRQKWKRGELSAQPRPGSALQPLPMAGRPAVTKADLAAAEAADEPHADRDGLTPVRDLRDDPRREELIKRLAREKAEKKRKALEDAADKR
ncbi:MAG: dCMP deaminase family protein [Candidatus Thermoplasmatota archaeon]